MPSINSDCSLGYIVQIYKFQIQRPNTRVLCYRQSSQRAIKCPTCASYEALVHQKLAVIQPYPGHLQRSGETMYKTEKKQYKLHNHQLIKYTNKQKVHK